MRLYLLSKQIVKNNQRYMLSFLMGTFVFGLFGYVSSHSYLREMTMVLLLGHSFLYPMLVASQLYHKVNIHHLASFPFKRTQILMVYHLLGYLLGLLGLFMMSLVGRLSMVQVMPLFMSYSYYYALFMLCFIICGHNLFYMFTCGIFGTFGFAVWGMMNTLLAARVEHFQALIPSDEVLTLLLPGMMVKTTPPSNIYYSLMVGILVLLGLSFLIVSKRSHEHVGEAVVYRPLKHILVLITSVYVAGGLMTFVTSGFGINTNGVGWMIHFILIVFISAVLVGLVYLRKFKFVFTLKLGLVSMIVLGAISYLSVYTLQHYTPERYQSVGLMIDYGSEVVIEEGSAADQAVRELQRLVMEPQREEGGHTIEFIHGYQPFKIHSSYMIDDDHWEKAVLLMVKNDITYQALMQNEYECMEVLSEGKITYVDIDGERYQLTTNEVKSIANVLSKQIKEVRYSDNLATIKANYIDSVAFGGNNNEYYIYGSRMIYDTVHSLLQSKGIIVE